MPRVTKSVTAKSKHKKVLKTTKGHYGARSRLFKTAKQSNIKSMQSRINAAAREIGMPYSKLINNLESKDINLNRKILSEIAISDSATFEKIVKIASN